VHGRSDLYSIEPGCKRRYYSDSERMRHSFEKEIASTMHEDCIVLNGVVQQIASSEGTESSERPIVLLPN
jgi:hypothetical protein